MDSLETSLLDLRTSAGKSQAQLADDAGISRQAYSAIEHGTSTPSTDVALRLAAALDATVESLFRLRQPRSPETARLTEPLPADILVRADVHRVGNRWIARPLTGSPARPAVTKSLPLANALVRPSVIAGEADIDLMEQSTANALVAVGCDPSVAVVAAHLQSRGVELSWHEMGSAAALQELARGHAHVAGCHLLDRQTGQYNLPAIARYLPYPTTVVTFAVWDQGLVVAPGNPKQVRGVEDLARPGILTVNREAGSGSRTLLDDALAGAGIDAEHVAGYDREARSHLSVAEAVSVGLADTGVAVRAAAIALGLDFVPLGQERYDLVIPNHYLDEDAIGELLAALRRPGLQRQIEALGGYDVARMGNQPSAA
jgi:molybdate-binding protein/DNA-binding XRE family transcriptional regulator